MDDESNNDVNRPDGQQQYDDDVTLQTQHADPKLAHDFLQHGELSEDDKIVRRVLLIKD